ncbi:MAG: radical SAM family RiPP maturation amino acid epimerase [Peptostreptococcaceae bacterium]|nr:radical SAM family RiPP maturation amino acid epimerase [Peptostreptococcaceae bacterium]
MSETYLYADIIRETKPEDLKMLANIKRFFECMVGDHEFQTEVIENIGGCSELLESRGIFGVDATQIIVFIQEASTKIKISEEDLIDKPQALLWLDWKKTHKILRDEWKKGSDQTPNKAFNKWHQRQASRCSSELGAISNNYMVHATIVFELSDGCSLHCPFCGLAAEPLKDVFCYTKENEKLWNEVLDVAINRLGSTVGTGVCYWATDPTDNPDYLEFVSDFGKKTGIYPQGTTAAPMRDIQWTQRMLEFRKKHITSIDRFSVLSLSMMHRIHETFTSEELLYTELVLQYVDSMKQSMARSGRNRNGTKDIKENEATKDHSIACVTGYLVNMVKGSVQLISPCPPSEYNPFGYIVFAEGHFTTAKELDEFIEYSFEQYMSENIGSEDMLAFRPDLSCDLLTNGFKISNVHKAHKIEGADYMRKLGELISKGNLSYSQVLDELSDQNVNILLMISTIQNLFSKGLLYDKTISSGAV